MGETKAPQSASKILVPMDSADVCPALKVHLLPTGSQTMSALQALQEEQARLKMRLQELQRNLRDCPQDKVPFPVPESPLVFRGHFEEGKAMAKSVVSHVRICYPLPGGSALVTFDDPNVAKQVLQQRSIRSMWKGSG